MSQEKKKIFTLNQIARSIQQTVESATGNRSFWIKAEIATLTIANSGIAYFEFVEQQDGSSIAKMRGTMWSTNLKRAQTALGKDFDNVLKNGSEIVFLAKVHFHVVYGLQLIVEEIDLSYTLGELERRKQETIERLKKEGVYGLNKEQKEPIVIQSIALITSKGSAAHQDFVNHLRQNEHHYRFELKLFNALVQGDTAAISLQNALEQIDVDEYDVVIFIRGGGSKLDLEPFNQYELCKKAAEYPLPIMTGIGHDTDLTVLDMVARRPHKTPTAIADYLIDKMVAFEKGVVESFIRISRMAGEMLKLEQLRMKQWFEVMQKYPVSYCQSSRGQLYTISSQLSRLVVENITDQKQGLHHFKEELKSLSLQKVRLIEPALLKEIQERLMYKVQARLELQNQQLKSLAGSIELLKPEKTLTRGFSITRQGDKALKSVGSIQKDVPLVTTLSDGKVISTVTKVLKHDKG